MIFIRKLIKKCILRKNSPFCMFFTVFSGWDFFLQIEFIIYWKINFWFNFELIQLIVYFQWWSPTAFSNFLKWSPTVKYLKNWEQRLHRTQIIWVCPDIWVFSVLHNIHLSDIWVICQKCQFDIWKVKKGLCVWGEKLPLHWM